MVGLGGGYKRKKKREAGNEMQTALGDEAGEEGGEHRTGISFLCEVRLGRWH